MAGESHASSLNKKSEIPVSLFGEKQATFFGYLQLAQQKGIKLTLEDRNNIKAKLNAGQPVNLNEYKK